MSEHNPTDANTDSDVKINLPYLQAPIPPTLQAKMAAIAQRATALTNQRHNVEALQRAVAQAAVAVPPSPSTSIRYPIPPNYAIPANRNRNLNRSVNAVNPTSSVATPAASLAALSIGATANAGPSTPPQQPASILPIPPVPAPSLTAGGIALPLQRPPPVPVPALAAGAALHSAPALIPLASSDSQTSVPPLPVIPPVALEGHAPVPPHPGPSPARSFPVPNIHVATATGRGRPPVGGMSSRRMRPNLNLSDLANAPQDSSQPAGNAPSSDAAAGNEPGPTNDSGNDTINNNDINNNSNANADDGATVGDGDDTAGAEDEDDSGTNPSSANPAKLGAGRPAGTVSGDEQQTQTGASQPAKRSFDLSSPFANFSKIVDPSGTLNFSGKAILHAEGVNFSTGAKFSISMDQLHLDEELGKGNYGTVKKVLHKPTNVHMAMKEIRLELDQAKLNGIIMELEVLHRAVAPEIVEFYGAFFIESCVYYCMEYMDAGSLDKLQGAGVPEGVLGLIAKSVVKGLKFLKEELNIIHRDVKPTNMLVNKAGEVKLCDFGVSGQLDKSLAKTNIGCQSYMAPERIQGESLNSPGTYTVASDVWSLGLSMIEVGMGQYPYPPETYSNVFAQLSAIVHGEPPELPQDKYGELARDWVARCLVKKPEGRATYRQLLEHPFLSGENLKDVDMLGWIEKALVYKEQQAEEQRRKMFEQMKFRMGC